MPAPARASGAAAERLLGAIPGTPLFAKVSHVLDGEFFLYLFSSIYKNFKGNFKLSLK